MELVKKTITVAMAEEDARLVERLWYEYNASRDIIKFLMSDENVIFKVLQEYINVAEKRFAELEMEKSRVANAIKPEEVDLTKWNFSFNFDTDEIVFEEA